jgi:hypothetical protein
MGSVDPESATDRLDQIPAASAAANLGRDAASMSLRAVADRSLST